MHTAILKQFLVVQVCVMGNWFGHASRGVVFGFWSGCASVGNIIGTIITSQIVPLGYQVCLQLSYIFSGVQWAFAVNSAILFFFAFAVYWHLVPCPREVGLYLFECVILHELFYCQDKRILGNSKICLWQLVKIRSKNQIFMQKLKISYPSIYRRLYCMYLDFNIF